MVGGVPAVLHLVWTDQSCHWTSICSRVAHYHHMGVCMGGVESLVLPGGNRGIIIGATTVGALIEL